MPNVFKKSIIRYLDTAGKQVPKGTAGARKVKEKSAKWYGRPRSGANPVPLCTNKTAAQIMLNELVKKAELAGVGVCDPFEAHHQRPLVVHLADFEAALLAKNRTDQHVKETVAKVRRILEGCKFVFIADLSASRVETFLAELRAQPRQVIAFDPEKEQFTRKELAALLGICPASAAQLAWQYRLEATGNGKARRFPRATAEALLSLRMKGRSVQTSNLYLVAVKSFCRWLVKDRRTGLNPLSHLEAGNVRLDRRHDRRELMEDELRSLLTVTRTSTARFRGLSGKDRFALYATACGTGFRASSLASLTPDHFDLDADTPTVTLAARHAKNKRTKVQPLPPDVAELLRDYMQGKPAGSPVWPGTWSAKGAEMLRLDLDAAGIPYTVEGPDGPLYADFHALRHSYLTLGGRAGIDLRTLQELAGHSTPTLTARYSHRRLYDLNAAVEKLPNFLPGSGSDEAAQLRQTGTDGAAAPVHLPASCPIVAQTIDIGCDSVMPIDTTGEEESGNDTGRNLSILHGVEASCERLITADAEAPPRFEPGYDGFAIRCLSTWLRGRACVSSSAESGGRVQLFSSRRLRNTTMSSPSQ